MNNRQDLTTLIHDSREASKELEKLISKIEPFGLDAVFIALLGHASIMKRVLVKNTGKQHVANCVAIAAEDYKEIEA